MPAHQESLKVYCNAQRIGTLRQEDTNLFFSYAPEYLQNPEAYALSQNLPLTNKVFCNPLVENFFSNLLPDERIRETVARILHVSPENTFGLLKKLGADCAGAISFYSEDATPPDAQNPVFRELTDSEALQILDNLSLRPLDAGDEGMRISGAGSQEKLVACIQNNRILLPLYGTPSTHIIKPPLPGFPESVFNELFCMRLAQKCGLIAAQCDILRIQDEAFYTVTRFDRKNMDGHVVRLHQEDFCQLLNVPPQLKYQKEGGPGVEECLQGMSEMRMPASEKMSFFRLLMFNFLIGNCDAHAKNYAVLYLNGKPSLAPAYDLLSTMVYDFVAKRFAMSIGGEMRMGMIRQAHFVELARKCAINPKLVSQELLALASRLPDEAQALAEELNLIHPSPIYRQITWEIKRNCLQIRR